MQRTGYFDASGKCLLIVGGDQEEPLIDYAYKAEVPMGLKPSTVEFVDGKIKEKKRDEPKLKVKAGPSLTDRVTALEVEIAGLKARLQ